MQGLADGDRGVAPVTAGQGQFKRITHDNQQLQLDIMRPFRQIALGLWQFEFDAQRAGCFFDAQQLPVTCAGQPMGGSLFATVHALNRFGIALQVTEPRPAHRHTCAHRLTLTEHGLVTQPQQRRLANVLVAEDLRALLGDQ
ncbi:hypothetical protein D3C81_1522110 [compost metagenome]